jgi:hypothetical protein
MPDFDQVGEIKARVQGRLFGIPGVHAVGVGHKIVNGQRTDDVAIMVFVVKKKPISELSPKEVIPPEIDGVKTDVYESAVPRPYVDDAPYPQLVGGIQVEPGGFPESAGTLGFFARKDGATPKIFAVTCHHVVRATTGVPTELDVQIPPNTDTITFGGTNTPGTLVLVRLMATPHGGPDTPLSDAFYVTTATDTLNSIATNVQARINALGVPGLSATAAGPVITIHVAAGFDLGSRGARSFAVHAEDRSARLQAFVRGNQILMAGIGADTGGAYTNVNVGGQTSTFGVFSALAKGAIPPDNAKTVAQSVQDVGIQDVSAVAAGSQLTITGAQEIECDVTTDIRVGHPTARFCSRCSPCCDRRIGRVFAARADMDAALVELDPGVKYKAEIEGIGPILGTKPVTASGAQVRKRGCVTLLQHGTIVAVNQDGHIFDPDPANDPPEWTLFNRRYTNAFSIEPGTFSDAGDSGAAIVDENTNNIMGLLFGGSNTITLATPVDPILTAFGVVLETATAADVVKTVPGAEAMSMTELASTPVFARALGQRLQQVRRQLETTETGAEFAAAVERHADEAQRIVNNNLRVAAVWHRNGGPQILQAALNAVFSPDQPLPHEIEGKPITECLQKIQQIFMRYASAAFAADLDRLGPCLIELCGLSYNQTLTALGGPEHSE